MDYLNLYQNFLFVENQAHVEAKKKSYIINKSNYDYRTRGVTLKLDRQIAFGRSLVWQEEENGWRGSQQFYNE